MIYPAWLGTNKVYPDWVGHLLGIPVYPEEVGVQWPVKSLRLVTGNIVYLADELRMMPFARECKIKLVTPECLPIALSKELRMLILSPEQRINTCSPEHPLFWLMPESRVVRFTGKVPPGQPDYLYLIDETGATLRDENGMDLTP